MAPNRNCPPRRAQAPVAGDAAAFVERNLD
jgi:hypothetical protein